MDTSITPQDLQLVVAAIPELPLPQCAAPQGSDEDGPQGYAGGEACLPLGWGWEGAKSQPSTKIGISPSQLVGKISFSVTTFF